MQTDVINGGAGIPLPIQRGLLVEHGPRVWIYRMDKLTRTESGEREVKLVFPQIPED